MVCQDGLSNDAVDQTTLRVFLDFTQVVILNGVLIGVEAEITSHRIELHSLQCFDQGFFVFDLAVGGTNGRIN